MSSEAAVPDPSMYPALSSYLTRPADREPRTAPGMPHPVAGPTYTTPPSVPATRGRHRAAASTRRRPRRHVLARRRTPSPPFAYASAALLAFATAALLAPSHSPAPGQPHAAPPQQPDAPGGLSLPVPDEAPTTPVPTDRPTRTPHPDPSARTDAPTPRSEPSNVLRFGSTGSSVLRLQEQLGQLRLYTGPLDGYYSHDVAAAVARMQQARAIDEPLGVYGPATRSAISTAAL
ncbi:peptidoglycan-binding protein [Streptomyces sp. NPDC050264]|uniref:peptidoglycan-binding protein n=1 Tax=Streptomyces sp. NPDC050264 TaxID=3155038 RepID=UPI0034422056